MAIFVFSLPIPGSAVVIFRTVERGMLKTISSGSKFAVATRDHRQLAWRPKAHVETVKEIEFLIQ